MCSSVSRRGKWQLNDKTDQLKEKNYNNDDSQTQTVQVHHPVDENDIAASNSTWA